MPSGRNSTPSSCQGTGEAPERVGVSVGHVVAVALVDADADPIDPGAHGQPGQREAERLAGIAKLATSDFMQKHDATLWIFAYLVNLI